MKRSLFLLAIVLLIATTEGWALAATIILTGRIVDVAGNPVAGAEVFLYTSANIRRPADFITPKTGGDGAYRIELPAGSYRAVARVRSSDRFGPLSPGDRHSGEPVLIEASDEPQLLHDFTVGDLRETAQQRRKTREELIRLEGRVLADGKPVAEAYVYLRKAREGEGIPEYVSAWTASDGTYQLLVPPGRYFAAASRDFPPTVKSDKVWELSVTAGKNAVAMDVELPLQ